MENSTLGGRGDRPKKRAATRSAASSKNLTNIITVNEFGEDVLDVKTSTNSNQCISTASSSD